MRKGLTPKNWERDVSFHSESESDIDLLKQQLLECDINSKLFEPKASSTSNSSLRRKRDPVIFDRPSFDKNIQGKSLMISGSSTERSNRPKSKYTSRRERDINCVDRSLSPPIRTLSPPIRRLHAQHKKLTRSSESLYTNNKLQRSTQKQIHWKDHTSNESASKQDKTTFPFRPTPSGNLKIGPSQIVYETQKVSVLVADPDHTQVNIYGDCLNSGIVSSSKSSKNMDKLRKNFAMMGNPRNDEANFEAEYSSNDEDLPESVADVLSPEIRLERLGITNTEPFSWEKVAMHAKTNLYEEINRRITNYILADCIVYIDNEEFSCHLIVLQSYSKYFENVEDKKVDLTKQTAVSPKAFATIYGWMITHEDDSFKLLTRDNCLELFSASKYLGIKELEEQCWMFIDSEEVFNEETAFLLFMEAKHRSQVDVMQLMIPRIRKFFLTLVSSQDYLELAAEEVCAFLSSNYIYINCEMEVLMSAVRWLRYDWKERQKHLVELMKCVRFGWIEPWQLIDVKRNPENPEFISIMKNPEVLRMVDDGLAFVIIKYWYGHKNDDFQHWLDVLGLEEPAHRNLSGEEKNYVTYRQFLEYLDVYRNEAIMEKTLPKVAKKTRNRSRNSQANVVESVKSLKHTIPTMDEMLASRKINFPIIRELEPQTTLSEEGSAWNLTDMMMKQIKRNETVELGKHRTIEDQLEKPMSRIREKPPLHSQDGRKKISRCSRDRMVQLQEDDTNRGRYSAGQDKPKPQYQEDDKNLARNELNTVKFGHSSQMKDLLLEGSLYDANRETILIFGGIDPHSHYGIGRNTGKDIYQYIPESNCWKFVTELPEPRHHHGVAFLHGRIYLVGGADPRQDEESHNKSSNVVNTVWSFDPVSRTWYNECSMAKARKNFGLVVIRQKMYAIGGQDRLGRVLASVERYEPNANKWEEMAPLKTPRMGIACAKYRDYIWVAGGMTGVKRAPLCNDVECYDTRSNEWTHVTNLRFPRCFSRLFVMNDTLYLIGGAGRQSDKNKGDIISLEAIDVWCAKDKQWRLCCEMAIPRHGHAVAYIGTQIIIIGGVTTVYMRALSNVECYCVERCTWVRGIAGLPTTLSGHGTVTLPPTSLM